MIFKFELGDTVKDRVTGYKGVVMARSEYFTGCCHYGLAGKMDKDGKVPEWEWIDETMLTKMSVKRITRDTERKTSGPAPDPPQA